MRILRSRHPEEGDAPPDEAWTDRIRAIRARAKALEELDGPLSGRVALVGAPESSVDVTIDLMAETIVLRSDRGTIGQWRLDDVAFALEEDGFQLSVEGERLLLATSDDRAFARGVGILTPGPERPEARTAGDLFR